MPTIVPYSDWEASSSPDADFPPAWMGRMCSVAYLLSLFACMTAIKDRSLPPVLGSNNLSTTLNHVQMMGMMGM